MTRKHFQMVADGVKTIEDPKVRAEVAAHFAGVFVGENPRFCEERFTAACGVHPPLPANNEAAIVDAMAEAIVDDMLG
jgi:hypothetical protein